MMNLYKKIIPIAILTTIIFILYSNDKNSKIYDLKERNRTHKVFIDSLERQYDSAIIFYKHKEDSLVNEIIKSDSLLCAITEEIKNNSKKIKNTLKYEEISNPDSIDNYIINVIHNTEKPK